MYWLHCASLIKKPKFASAGDELAKKLSWKARWDTALGIGSCLRYLHEECLDGPIVHLAISSSRIVLSHNFSPLVS